MASYANKAKRKGPPPLREEGREKWIMAAWNSIGRAGFEPVRIEPLAKELSISKGSFYWHFADRQDLIDALINRWLNLWELPDALLALEDPGERLWSLVERVIRRETRGQGAVLRCWSHNEPEIARRIHEADENRHAFLVDQLIQLGFIEREADIRARLYQAFISGEFLRHGDQPLEKRLKEAKQQHELLIGRFGTVSD